jgi:hypothetical protein
MRKFLVTGAIGALVCATPVLAQGPAYPTPDNNVTRSDDVDPADAANLSEEHGLPSDPDVLVVPEDVPSSAGSSTGETGDEEPDLPPSDATPPPE